MGIGNPKHAEKVVNGVRGHSYESRKRLVTEADALTFRSRELSLVFKPEVTVDATNRIRL
jgi:hypothetical protein